MEDFKVDPWEVYSFPTEEELEYIEEWENRRYQRMVDDEIEKILTDFSTIKGCYEIESGMRRVFLIRKFLKEKYPRLEQIGVKLTQDEVESILVDKLTEGQINLLHGILHTEYENSFIELNHKVGHATGKLEAVVLNSILDFIKELTEEESVRSCEPSAVENDVLR
jgi:hypothetical protein